MINKLLGEIYWDNLPRIISEMIEDKYLFIPTYKDKVDTQRLIASLSERTYCEYRGVLYLKFPDIRDDLDRPTSIRWNKTALFSHLSQELDLCRSLMLQEIRFDLNSIVKDDAKLKEAFYKELSLESDLDKLFPIWVNSLRLVTKSWLGSLPAYKKQIKMPLLGREIYTITSLAGVDK